MPTYEYACPKCGIVEAFQSIKEPALSKCPQCKKAKVHRMISTGGGVIFKGSGFWETDYNRSSDYASKAKSENGEGDKSKTASGDATTKNTSETSSASDKKSDKKTDNKTSKKTDPATPAPQPQAQTKPTKLSN
jgi:putative FmdB family regulatory protein